MSSCDFLIVQANFIRAALSQTEITKWFMKIKRRNICTDNKKQENKSTTHRIQCLK